MEITGTLGVDVMVPVLCYIGTTIKAVQVIQKREEQLACI